MFHIHATRRAARNALVSAVIAGSGLAGVLGVTAGTAHASTDGFVTVASCGAVAGKITYSPGLLTSTTQATNATMTGFVSNCTDLATPLAEFGKLAIQMSGNASKAAENFGGTFTINWPGSLNPSTGTVSVSEVNGVEQLSGTITSGALTGGVIGAHYVITTAKGSGAATSPVTSQTYINNTSLTVQENTG
jgi:hypothetical protein